MEAEVQEKVQAGPALVEVGSPQLDSLITQIQIQYREANLDTMTMAAVEDTSEVRNKMFMMDITSSQAKLLSPLPWMK